MRLLITGASGFVGLNLVRALAASNRFSRILATDYMMPDAKERAFAGHSKVVFSTLDVTNRAAVSRLLAEWRPSHVIHAAAITPAGEISPEQITRIYDVNLQGSINLFEAAAINRVDRVLSLSSSGVYAHSGGNCRHEDDELSLSNPYAGSKRAAEIVSLAYVDHTDIVSVRLGPVYGPMEKARPTRPRVSFIGVLSEALRDHRSIMISGPDIIRDWLFADDVSQAFLNLLTAPTLRNRIYNVSSGQGYALSTVIDVFRALGLKVHWSGNIRDDADIILRWQDERTPLSIERLRNDTGFSPSFDLHQGIAATVRSQFPSLAANHFQE